MRHEIVIIKTLFIATSRRRNKSFFVKINVCGVFYGMWEMGVVLFKSSKSLEPPTIDFETIF